MILKFFEKGKAILQEAVSLLSGSQKRRVLAKTAQHLGRGGQSLVAEAFQVSRNTIRKGLRELESDTVVQDQYGDRGRRLAEEKLPRLLEDIRAVVDSQSQTDPSFKTERLYTRLTVKEIRERLIREKGYTEDELPTLQTLNTKINKLGYTLRKVKKTKPLKKIEQTDAIFEQLKQTRDTYHGQSNVACLSIDTKDRVKIGNFSRGGVSRMEVKAADHDFSQQFVTPFGILDVCTDQVGLFFTTSKVTADFMVDRIKEYWKTTGCEGTKDTLVLYCDNGPESHSRRTQFMKRIVEFAVTNNVTVILAYYPPYHSKYNPIERVWGRLEQHWNGELLETETTVYRYAETMTWKGQHPFVSVNEQVYETGKKLNKNEMDKVESRIDRDEAIGKWFVTIHPEKCKDIVQLEIST
jgi:transposase